MDIFAIHHTALNYVLSGTQKAVPDVAHVEHSGADLLRGGRRHGRAAGAGVSVASRTSLRRDGHTKVYCGRSEQAMRPHARIMEEPTQIADCVTQQRRCSGQRSVRTSIAHGRSIMRNHDLVSDGFLTLIAASLVVLGSSLLAFAIV
jgi:hypothetical protein